MTLYVESRDMGKAIDCGPAVSEYAGITGFYHDTQLCHFGPRVKHLDPVWLVNRQVELLEHT